MTRRLILIRHAKSSWADAFADDHGRKLNDRGVRSAEAIGRWLSQQGDVPDTIATSDAMRTRQTTALLKKGMGQSPETFEVAALYHAAPQTIIDVGKAMEGCTVSSQYPYVLVGDDGVAGAEVKLEGVTVTECSSEHVSFAYEKVSS